MNLTPTSAALVINLNRQTWIDVHIGKLLVKLSANLKLGEKIHGQRLNAALNAPEGTEKSDLALFSLYDNVGPLTNSIDTRDRLHSKKSRIFKAAFSHMSLSRA